MPTTVTAASLSDLSGERLAAELQAYNHAFTELELPWQWDVETFRGLLREADSGDCIGAYIERNQAHLLRVYDKSFLRDLVLSTKARRHAETPA